MSMHNVLVTFCLLTGVFAQWLGGMQHIWEEEGRDGEGGWD